MISKFQNNDHYSNLLRILSSLKDALQDEVKVARDRRELVKRSKKESKQPYEKSA